MNNWSLEMGFYPGILFGFRVYQFKDNSKLYTLYLPFIDFSLEVY
jgi:hypothetical protein